MNLFGRASRDIDLIAAIEECADVLFQAPLIGLLYTPEWCGFAAVERKNGSIELIPPSPKEKGFDRARVFEARFFNEYAELRWIQQFTDKGRAALIAEEDVSNHLDDEAGMFEDVDFIDQTYLLWGEGTAGPPDELHPGWSRLAMARIGTMDVPYPLDTRTAVCRSGERVHLIAREYLSFDEHGNVAVVEERLRKLARAL